MSRYRFPGLSLPAQEAPFRKDAACPAVLYQCALEAKFPHILTSIQALWGFKEMNTYFTKLTLDERGGRAGFPSDVWDEIHTLLRLHQEIMPEALFSTNISRHALDFVRSN